MAVKKRTIPRCCCRRVQHQDALLSHAHTDEHAHDAVADIYMLGRVLGELRETNWGEIIDIDPYEMRQAKMAEAMVCRACPAPSNPCP